MRTHSKRFLEALEKAPKGKLPLKEALEALKTLKPTKFDQTVELSLHLGVDVRQADQALRGSDALPHGIGATKKVIAFCDTGDAEKAKAAGAIEAGGDDLIKKVQDGWMDFDVALATPAMMRNVSRLGRVLGPQGKMPSPKAGTVVDDIATAVREFAAGKIEYRTDDGGNLHVPVGRLSFETTLLSENVEAFLAHVRRIKPTTAKGTYLQKLVISATMSPGIQLDIQ